MIPLYMSFFYLTSILQLQLRSINSIFLLCTLCNNISPKTKLVEHEQVSLFKVDEVDLPNKGGTNSVSVWSGGLILIPSLYFFSPCFQVGSLKFEYGLATMNGDSYYQWFSGRLIFLLEYWVLVNCVVATNRLSISIMDGICYTS